VIGSIEERLKLTGHERQEYIGVRCHMTST
jgi:hypothetical protein